MASKQKLFDATYPGAATPITKNRLQQPIVLHRDTGYDKKHSGETDHFKAKDNHGVEFKYLYVGENYRLRPDSSGDCVVEAYDGSSWVEAVRIDSDGIEAEYVYIGESIRLSEGTDELVIEAHDGSSWSEHLSLSTTSGVVDFSDMPEVGGDPVVESGSNSDGEWTRWADGTQVCQQRVVRTNVSITHSYGDLYQDQVPWDYPVSFSETPATPAPAIRWGTSDRGGKVMQKIPQHEPLLG